MSIDSRIPELVRPIVRDYIRLTEKRLLGLIDGSYLIGSIALGEFNEYLSDIDFVTILNRRATPVDIEHLRKIHQTLENSYPRWKMSGSYVQHSDLGKLEQQLMPHPHFHDGVLHPVAQHGLNAVIWWELKHCGITVLGADPRNLPIDVNWDLLIEEMRANLNSYWRSWTRHPWRVMALYTDWGIQWAVLGILRQFYTFRENSITTKIKAGEYALRCLPNNWHPLIQDAIHIRQGKKDLAYRFRFGRMIHAVNFLKYVIHCCNSNSIL